MADFDVRMLPVRGNAVTQPLDTILRPAFKLITSCSLLLYVVREIFVVAATALVTPTTELFMRVCSVIVLKNQNIKANEAVASNKSKV